jgi:filamentous hemagglutinin family protein
MHRHASVNRIYRLVWSHASDSWVPAAETSRGRKKGSSKTLLAAALSLVSGLAEATPLGGQVVSGSGHIGQSGALTTITQTSQVLSLSWASFNIAPQETVDFVQPSASAIAVNRITGSNGTQILGHLEANGQVYLINPNGIVFGRGAQVNVGGLVASTLDADIASLGSDSRTFSGTGSGGVVNQGTINATGDGAGGGYVALLGNHVTNQGTISARLGTVALGAGSAATLTFQGDSLVHMQVDRSVLNSVAANGGLIRADGGQVLMSAGAKDTLLASVVNNTGVIEARTVQEHAGTISLLGGMAAGTVNVAGTLDASAPAGGNGGFVETSAANVELANTAKITTAAAAGLTGSWLIDPKDFTVAASGGNITGAALSTQLATTNVTEQSSAGATTGSGNVNINDPVSWSANHTLTLTASNNVNINASVTATGSAAGVILNPNTGNGSESASGVGTLTFNQGAAINLTGASATVSVAGVSYIVINALGVAADATTAPSTPSLQGMAATANLSKNYALGSNINAGGTSTWPGGAGFKPIGNSSSSFLGAFTGLGHTITGLFINLPTTNDVGLFGYTGASGTATIQNVGLVGGSVTGSSNVGLLVGWSLDNVNNSFGTGTVTGSGNVGGLVGQFNCICNSITLNNSYATATVVGSGSVGGLVGQLGNGTTLNNSYATGTVSGQSNVGGLVGSQSYSSINSSHASGNVSAGSGGSNVGGLVGSSYA